MLFEKITASCSQNHNKHVIHHGVKRKAIRRIRILGKNAYSVISVRTAARISSTPSARIFVKFDNGDFHLNLCKKIKIWLHLG